MNYSDPQRRPQPPYPVVISDYQPGADGYGPTHYHYPAPQHPALPPKRRKTNWLVVAVLLGILGIMAWVNYGPPLTSIFPALEADAGPSAYWFEGAWKAPNADAPKLVLRPKKNSLSGWLTQNFAKRGYLAAMPVVAGVLTPEGALVFKVDSGEPNSAVFYLLQQDGEGKASLYRLSSPPNTPIKAILLPDGAGAGANHRLVSQMVRPN
jgi:hypothetical protein